MATKPGAPPSNQPSNFAFLVDDRLTNNGNLSRLPSTDREWGAFIQELNKWVKNETGNFDPTFTGFSADPSTLDGEGPSVVYHRFGQMVTLSFYFSVGTSDATGFTITNLPSFITPKFEQIFPMGNLVDGGSATFGAVHIGTNGVITFYPDDNTGSWTASSTKGFFDSQPPQTVVYSLFNPPKL